ncbi:MAG: signal peptidase I [Clostridiales bacterium]|nr:signal peptidase I [Clostridiales bacterium]
MRGIKKAIRVASNVLTAFLALVLCANVYTIIMRSAFGVLQPTVFGFSSAVVMSGSMSGAIEVDDMVVIKEKSDYETGDIITYFSGNTLITHRVVEKTDEGFYTKGDANNTPDPKIVDRESIVGKVVLIIPRVGRLISFIRTPLGMFAMVLIGFVLIEAPLWFERRSVLADDNNK